MMGIEKGTCWDEHGILYVSNESWESTPKAKSTLYILYVSQIDNKLYLKKEIVMKAVRIKQRRKSSKRKENSYIQRKSYEAIS